MMLFAGQLMLVLLADLLIGDPRWRFHPIRLIGLLCRWSERQARRLNRRLSLRWCGGIAFSLVLAVTTLVTVILLILLNAVHPYAGTAGALVLLYFSIAAGDLIRHASRVKKRLHRDEIVAARAAVAMMVGRDTDGLSAGEIARACIESVAENLVDGITAPLFWAVIGSLVAAVIGAPPLLGAAVLAIGYKAVSTMDSMYGYRNERYLTFGRCAARADDYAAFIPARLTGLCVVAAAFLPGFNGRQAAQVFFADRLRSSSPNSGHGEAAAAGALGVQLGGPARYFGVKQVKPLIGAGLRTPCADDISRCNYLIVAATMVFVVIMLAISMIIEQVI